MSYRERYCGTCGHARLNEEGEIVCKRKGKTYGSICSSLAGCRRWIDRDDVLTVWEDE